MRIKFAVFALFACAQLFAQKGQLTGKVVDKQSEEAMLYVTVSVHDNEDSSLITGAITDVEGKFKIADVPLGKKYIFKCSFIGYATKFIDIDFTSGKTVDLGNVVLSPGNEVLDGVEVTADKPLVTYEIDKKVVNVEDMNTVAAQTAVEVLANIPSISVDMDGNISLRGSQGFTLLIDGRPSALPASEALQLIQASNIKDIEIITNPSAKYDAEGTSGIINVILKKNKLEGISTLINLSGGNSGNGPEYLNYNGNFLVSINKGKFKFNFGGQWVTRNRFRDIEQVRITTIGDQESKIESQGLHRFFGNNYGGNIAMEYAPTNKDFITIGLDVKQRQWNAAANYWFDQFLDDSLVSSYENREQTLRTYYNMTASLGYQHLINGDKDHYLSFVTTFSGDDGGEDAVTEFFTEENTLEGGNWNTEVGPSANLRFSLDYQRPLQNGMKVMVGARSDFSVTSDDQDSYSYDLSAEEYVHLDLYSTDVSYLQDVHAGYAIVNGKFKEKLGYQFGLRGEYTDRLIELTNSDINTTIERLDWFPSAHFSYQLDAKNQFKASASKRISRPRSWHLEPFVAWEDPYTVRQGNPDLLPEYIQSYELGYIRELAKGSFSTELYFRNTNNIRQRIQEVYDTNVIVKRPVNAGVSEAMGAEFAFNKKLAKWWSFDLGANFFYYQIAGEISGESLDQQSFSYRGRMSNNFNLPKDFKLQLITNYESDIVNVQGRTAGFASFDLALKKDFLEHKISTTLQFRNMFATEKRESWVDTETLYSYRLARPKYPIVSLSVAFKLNNFSNKDKIRTEEGSEF